MLQAKANPLPECFFELLLSIEHTHRHELRVTRAVPPKHDILLFLPSHDAERYLSAVSLSNKIVWCGEKSTSFLRVRGSRRHPEPMVNSHQVAWYFLFLLIINLTKLHLIQWIATPWMERYYKQPLVSSIQIAQHNLYIFWTALWTDMSLGHTFASDVTEKKRGSLSHILLRMLLFYTFYFARKIERARDGYPWRSISGSRD